MRPDGPAASVVSLPAPATGLRIACVCTDPGIPTFGCKGSSVHVQEVLRALLRVGHRPELFTPRPGGAAPRDLNDVPVHRLPAPDASQTAEREVQARELDRELGSALADTGPFDLVYQRYALWSDAGMRYARCHGIPAILEVNAPLVEEQARHRSLVDRSTAEAVTRSAILHADHVVAVSDVVARWVRSIGEVEPASKVHVIPNGVDPHRFPAGTRHPARNGSEPFTLGFVGTLKPWHGLTVLLDAFRLLVDGGADAKLLLVGDGPERGRLESEVARAGLGPRVTFTGSVAPARIPALLGAMHVAVAPYPAPGPGGFYFSPLKVLEYMAAGLPVVASRVATIEEMIESGRHGVLVEPGSAEALAGAMDALRRDPDARARLGAAARARVESRYTWDQVVARILDAAGLPPANPDPEERGALATFAGATGGPP
jgi:glycosyltransferase involved in cell wall biosynthesis